MVSKEHRDLLRFLWWKDEDPANEVVKNRIKVHIFGPVSSPCCANVGLKRAADDGEDGYGEEAAEFIRTEMFM